MRFLVVRERIWDVGSGHSTAGSLPIVAVRASAYTLVRVPDVSTKSLMLSCVVRQSGLLLSP